MLLQYFHRLFHENKAELLQSDRLRKNKPMKAIFVLITLSNYQLVNGCTRRRSSPPPPSPRNCQVGSWSSWGGCSHRCGNAGTQSRSRSKTVSECCGGRCTYQLSESRACNRDACSNGGTPAYGRCNCRLGWTGTCCENGK